jgi:hypothetical protein
MVLLDLSVFWKLYGRLILIIKVKVNKLPINRILGILFLGLTLSRGISGEPFSLTPFVINYRIIN